MAGFLIEDGAYRTRVELGLSETQSISDRPLGSTRGNSVFHVWLLELEIYKRVSNPAMGPYRPRVVLGLF